MQKAPVWAAATTAAGLVLGAVSAYAVAIPYSLGGTWICTFKNGDTAKVMARPGQAGVQWQYNAGGQDGQLYKQWVSNTGDGGITAHGDGWAWTLTPKDGAAEMVWESKAKGETYTVPCAKK
ncbi:MAG TPA: hypothetical protein VHA35_07100 [Dongiaceae bacterium]|jgi:hypothetical protein|nr:hypothetical protein [Dongiaceae bacterium]